MFTVLKVRDDLAPGDFRDPGWYAHPPGTVAREWTGELAEPQRAPAPAADATTLRARKPEGHRH
jgi:hypothetical protein